MGSFDDDSVGLVSRRGGVPKQLCQSVVLLLLLLLLALLCSLAKALCGASDLHLAPAHTRTLSHAHSHRISYDLIFDIKHTQKKRSEKIIRRGRDEREALVLVASVGDSDVHGCVGDWCWVEVAAVAVRRFVLGCDEGKRVRQGDVVTHIYATI